MNLLATSGQWEWEVCSEGGELRDCELNPMFLSDLRWKMLAFLFFWMVMESLWRKKITKTEIEVPSGSCVPSSDVWNSDIKKVWLICANNWMPQLLKLLALLMCAWDTKANYKTRVTKTCSSCGHRLSTYAS